MIIIGINGSPRGEQSQSRRLINAALTGAKEAGADTELADLCRMSFSFCRACDTCHATGQCVHQDQASKLLDRLMQADGIILGSPSYFRSVTAPMKAFIDRLSQVIHCQLFAGKYGGSISTAGGPSAGVVADYLNDVLISLGLYSVGSVAVSLSNGQNAMTHGLEQAAAMGRDLVAAIADKRVYDDQKKTHMRTASYFRNLVELNKTLWPHEHNTWKKQEE